MFRPILPMHWDVITAYPSTRSLSPLAKGKTDVVFLFMRLIGSDFLIVDELYWLIIGQ